VAVAEAAGAPPPRRRAAALAWLLAPLFLAGAAARGTAVPAAAPAAAGGRGIAGIVVSVVDGDTITVAAEGGERVRVRLWGIDAPEVPHRGRPGQPWGREARDALRRKIHRMPVVVEPVEVDSYGRLVGLVRLGSRNVNAEMVAEGHAWAYRRFLGRPYASSFVELERAARRKRLGLWSEANPVPPWEFKRRIGVGR